MYDKIVYKCKKPNKSLHPTPYLMRAIHKNGNVHSSAHFVRWDDVSSYGHILLFSNQCHKFYLRFAIAFVQCTYRLHFRYTHLHTPTHTERERLQCEIEEFKARFRARLQYFVAQTLCTQTAESFNRTQCVCIW